MTDTERTTPNPIAEALSGAQEPDPFRVILDLENAVAAYQHGKIMVWMTWVRTPDRWEPCIALTRPNLYDAEGGRAVPCIIPLNRAYAWVGAMQASKDQIKAHPAILADLRDVMASAADFAFTLGLNGMVPRDVFKVMSAVDDHLQDLLTMQPRPLGLGERHVADLIVTDRKSGKVWEQEVRDVL